MKWHDFKESRPTKDMKIWVASDSGQVVLARWNMQLRDRNSGDYYAGLSEIEHWMWQEQPKYWMAAQPPKPPSP